MARPPTCDFAHSARKRNAMRCWPGICRFAAEDVVVRRLGIAVRGSSGGARCEFAWAAPTCVGVSVIGRHAERMVNRSVDHAVRLRSLPIVRFLFTPMSVAMGVGAAVVAVTSVRSEPYGAAILLVFASWCFWLAWRWWILGVTVSWEKVTVAGIFVTRAFSLDATRGASSYRRGVLATWLLSVGTHSVVLLVDERPFDLARLGIFFDCKDSATRYADLLDETLSSQRTERRTGTDSFEIPG